MRAIVIFAMTFTSIATLAQTTNQILPDAPSANRQRTIAPLIAELSPAPKLEAPSVIAAKLVPGTRCCGIEISDDHRFWDRQNKRLFVSNLVLQTGALLAIQSHGGGGGHWFQSRGRTLDPFEKHFESYGYGWGAVYRYGGCTAFPLAVAAALHHNGNHKLERWAHKVTMLHAAASIGYALQGNGTKGDHY